MKSLKLTIYSSIILLSLFFVKAEPAQAGITFSGFVQFIGNFFLVSSSPCQGITQITDTRDTNNSTYLTVEIGTQCWLKRNENVGTMITGATSQTNNATLEKYCYSDTEANCTTDGGFYQWAEAMQYKNSCSNTTYLQPTEPVQGICPTGWHIPTDAEAYTLENYLKIEGRTCNAARGGWDCNDAGTDLKSSGSPYFYAPLAGYRHTNGSFVSRATMAVFWFSTQFNATLAWSRYMDSSHAEVARVNNNKAYGLSVRCLKD